MIKVCCNELIQEIGRTIFGVIPNLEIKQMAEEIFGEGKIYFEAKIRYCPFCGEKLQNLSNTFENLGKPLEDIISRKIDNENPPENMKKRDKEKR